MPLTVLIADDEPPARAELVALLRADARVTNVLEAASGAEALRLLSGTPVDVALLDIHMPGLDGIDLARALGQFHARPAVIFVTADAARALDAFDVAAVDYLLKPVRTERLYAALSRAVDATGSTNAVAHDDERIPVTVGTTTHIVRRSEVRWVGAQGDYSRLWTATSGHLIRTPISDLDTRWAEFGFVRVHRSYLVHEDAITVARLSGSSPTVSVAEVELPVSRRLLPAVRERLLRDAP